MDRNISYFCVVADRAAANLVAEVLGAGPDNFTVPLAMTEGVTDRAFATHYGGSGVQTQEVAEAFETSVSPLLQIRSNENKTFDEHLAESVPQLYRVIESI